MNALNKMVQGILDMIGDDEYKTVVIGVLVGSKEEVLTTEKEFDEATDDLLAAHEFIKLSGFTIKTKGNPFYDDKAREEHTSMLESIFKEAEEHG